MLTLVAIPASSQTTTYWTGRSNCPNGNCPQSAAPVRYSAPVPSTAAPKPIAKVESPKIDWSINPKPSVKEIVAEAIKNNKSVRTEIKAAPNQGAISVRTEPVNKTQPLHYHQCAKCGTVFGHTDSSFGSPQQHMCPTCGYGPNYTVIRRD